MFGLGVYKITTYRPLFTLTSGSNNLAVDTLDIKVRQVLTKEIPTFEISLDNRLNKWASILWHDSINLTIDSEPILYGYIDKIVRPPTKRGADILNLKGRGSAGALEDIYANKHYAGQTAAYIVSDLVASYNTLKGSADPVIHLASGNDQPSNEVYVRWNLKSHWKMFDLLSSFLGAPVAFGGADKFYDFLVDTSHGLVFKECGQIGSSGVDLDAAYQIIQPERTIDAYPVRTAIWVIASESDGTIPVWMQLGYGGQDRYDIWSEGNAGDYGSGTATTTNCQSVYNSSAYTAASSTLISLLSILGSFSIPVSGGSITDYAYFYLRFPITRVSWTYGIPPSYQMWPSQDPGGGLNTFNMTRMHETMGEINGIGFYLMPRSPYYEQTIPPCQFRLEAVDGQNTPVTIVTQKVDLTADDWVFFQHAFGPATNVVINETQHALGSFLIVDPDPAIDPTITFDWANVAEIRFKLFATGTTDVPSNIDLYMDGFRFIKPLVAYYKDASDTVVKNAIVDEDSITSYAQALQWAASQAEYLRQPLQYYKVLNMGRVDIDIGKTFTYDGKTLVARGIDYRMAKGGGWQIDLEGYEPT